MMVPSRSRNTALPGTHIIRMAASTAASDRDAPHAAVIERALTEAHGRHQTGWVRMTAAIATMGAGAVRRSSVGPNIAVTWRAECRAEMQGTGVVRDERARGGEDAGERRHVGPPDDSRRSDGSPSADSISRPPARRPRRRSGPDAGRRRRARGRARQITPPATVWRRHMPRQAPGRPAASSVPSRRRPRAARRRPDLRRHLELRLVRPVGKSQRAHEMPVVVHLMDAGRRATMRG